MEEVDKRLDSLLMSADCTELYEILLERIRCEHETADTRGMLKKVGLGLGLIHYSAFLAALDRNPGMGYDTLLLRMIPGDILSAIPHRHFHTLPGLLEGWVALPNSYPNALRAMQGGSLYHFYDGLWYDPAERRTHDLPCERRTRYRLSQPDTIKKVGVQYKAKRLRGFDLNNS